jgi:hypothetical protein
MSAQSAAERVQSHPAIQQAQNTANHYISQLDKEVSVQFLCVCVFGGFPATSTFYVMVPDKHFLNLTPFLSLAHQVSCPGQFGAKDPSSQSLRSHWLWCLTVSAYFH